MQSSDNCEITNKTKGKLPSLPFVSIKNKVLGEKYDLSVVFVTPKESRKINFKYRKIDSPTNILSFPLSKNSGEIFLELTKIKKDAPKFGMKSPEFLKYLFIHGLLHLKGFKHSDTMETEEKRILKFFS